MTTQFGFCNNCGAPRATGAAGFCASCGASLPALAAAPPPPPPPPQEQAQAPWAAAPPPPPPPPAGQWSQPPQQTFNAQPGPAWGASQPPERRRQGMNPLLIVGAIIVIAALAIGGFFLLGGNKGGTASGSPGATAAATLKPGQTAKPAATQGGNNGGSDLGNAENAFANINSFKFSMTLQGGPYSSMLGAFGAGPTGDAPFTINGTIVLKPEKASDIELMGIHMIEIGGFDYMDLSGTGMYYKTAQSGSSMADSFSPESIFASSMRDASGSAYSKVGTETKNGVQANHYQATNSALAGFGSAMGVPDAQWSSDIWIAVDGGYPVSMSVIGVAADNSTAFQMTFDLTNVNDPGNKISAPTNVMGG